MEWQKGPADLEFYTKRWEVQNSKPPVAKIIFLHGYLSFFTRSVVIYVIFGSKLNLSQWFGLNELNSVTWTISIALIASLGNTLRETSKSLHLISVYICLLLHPPPRESLLKILFRLTWSSLDVNYWSGFQIPNRVSAKPVCGVKPWGSPVRMMPWRILTSLWSKRPVPWIVKFSSWDRAWYARRFHPKSCLNPLILFFSTAPVDELIHSESLSQPLDNLFIISFHSGWRLRICLSNEAGTVTFISTSHRWLDHDKSHDSNVPICSPRGI